MGKTEMAVDGNWNIVMTTPMGERKATLNVKSAGGTLTGTQGADGNSGEIFDGTVNGDNVARIHRQGFWRQHVRRNGHRPDGQFSLHGDEGVRDPVVMAGLDPAIHHSSSEMDMRVMPAYDD
jgi:hypothetical protein